MMTSIEELAEFGQSVWLDNISRKLFEDGSLKKMIDDGLRGMTSNPSIFHKAIAGGSDYDDLIRRLCQARLSAQEVYEEITVGEIQRACDVFLPVYEKTDRLDGYVSLEINPHYARDTRATIAEGKRLHEKVARANLMIKVPASPEGYPAVEELLSAGINVNATLIFSLKQYLEVVRSYMRGLQRFIDTGKDPSGLRSVASVFVSRMDTVADRLLDEKMAAQTDAIRREGLQQLKGKAAVAYVALIYKHYRQIFAAGQFHPYVDRGAHYQRVLWGSTSTKNPAYSDIKYVSELIARDTVNTMPEATFRAFLGHGEVSAAFSDEGTEYQRILEALGKEGIELDAICDGLMADGVDAFVKAYDGLIASIEKKSQALCQ